MNYEEQEGGYRPPYIDPLSGATVATPTVEVKSAPVWTPPPRTEAPPQAAPTPRPAGGSGGGAHSWPPREESGVSDEAVDEAISAVLEIFKRDEQTQQPVTKEPTPPEAPKEPERWSAPAEAEKPAPAPVPPSDTPPPPPPWMGGRETQQPTPDYRTEPPAPGAGESRQQYYGGGPTSGIDPKTAVAVAAAMAAVFTDIGRTTYGGYQQQSGGYQQQSGGYEQQPGGYPQQPGGYPQQPGGYPQQPGGYPQQPGGYPQSGLGSGDFASFEGVVASIMAEASRRGGQQGGVTPPPVRDSVAEVVAEVQSWDTERTEEQRGPNGGEVTESSWDPIQAEASRIIAQNAAVESAPYTPEAQVQPSEPWEKEPKKSSQPKRKPATDSGGRDRRGKRKRPKLKIAKEARAKGMRGGINYDKTSVNVAMQVKTMASPSRAIPLFLLALVCIAAFSWFGVIQLLASVAAEEQILAEKQRTVGLLSDKVADYDALKLEYSQFGSDWMDAEEQAQVDVLNVLALLESELLPGTRVKSAMMSGNLLAVSMSGITLDATAGIVSSLEKLDIVQGVSVYTAASVEDQGGIVTSGGYVPDAPAGAEAPVVPEKPVLPGGDPGTPAAPDPAASGVPVGGGMNTTVNMTIRLARPEPPEQAPATAAPAAPAAGEGGGTT